MCPRQLVPKHVYISSVQGVFKLVHMLCTSWALAWAHVHFQGLGTPTSTAVNGVGLHLLCTQSSNSLYSSLAQESHRRVQIPTMTVGISQEELLTSLCPGQQGLVTTLSAIDNMILSHAERQSHIHSISNCIGGSLACADHMFPC